MSADAPGVEKDEFEVETGAKHEHVAVKFDFGDGAARQRVTDGDQSRVLVAAVERRRVQRALTNLQVAAAVNHLPARQSTSSSSSSSSKVIFKVA